ncbi:potassium channel protein [bacterium]|nr:potassium channel protein [bacterium]
MKFLMAQLTTLLQTGARQSNVRLLVRFLILLVGIVTLYSVLFHVIMEYEGQSYSWVTGFYWTLTVMSTLGFGDITFQSDLGRIFSMMVLLSGVIFLLVMLPFTFIQFFYAPWLEAQNRARAPRALPAGTRGHVIITAFDIVTANLIRRLGQLGFESVVLVDDLAQALELHDLGYRVMVGDRNHPDTYRNLRVEDAAMVVAIHDDVVSTNVIYTVREISDQVLIVANADEDDSLDILSLAGSRHVFQFHRLLGQALARRVLGVSLRANVVGRIDDLVIAELPTMATTLVDQTLLESSLRERTGVNVVGVWDRGSFHLPTPQTRLDPSTVLVVAGTDEQLEDFQKAVQNPDAGDASGAPDTPPRPAGPVLILGGGRVGQAVAASLKARGVEHRIVDKSSSIGKRNRRVITGNAADREVLERAGLDQTPSIIITTHDDDLNVYLTIYCRRLRPDAQIISRASLNRNVATLHRAGADLVMSYSAITTATIVNLLRPGRQLLLAENVNIASIGLAPHQAGRSLLDLNLRQKTGCSVIAVKRGARQLANPDPREPLEAGDELVLVGDADRLAQMAARGVAG